MKLRFAMLAALVVLFASSGIAQQTSAPATFTITAAATPPKVTSQPANVTVIAGQTATFTVVASGTAPLSYQWRKNQVNIAGANSPSYTTPATVIGDNGAIFNCTVSNSAGSVLSGPGNLTVNAPPTPTITTLSPNTTAAGSAQFTMTITGTNFASNATVGWTSTAVGSTMQQLATTFVSATQVTAVVPASLVTAADTINVTVTNPASTSVTGHAVILNWKPGTTCGQPPCDIVTSYQVFKSSTPGGPYDICALTPDAATLTATDNWVWAGSTYYYVVAAIGSPDSNPPYRMSTYSNEAKAVIPTP